MRTSIIFFLCIALPFKGFGFEKVDSFRSSSMKIAVEQLIEGLEIPWGFDFLAKDKIIVSERQGTMKIFDMKNGSIWKVTGLPKVVHTGQGGLLDVAIHKHATQGNLVFFTYAAAYQGGSTTRLAQGTLRGPKMTNVRVLFTAKPAMRSRIHYGSRIAFDQKGHIFFSVGDRGHRDMAQNLRSHLGKVMRLNLDGSVPKDNPFYHRKKAYKEIWTYGHRNPQGLARHPQTGDIWEQEHGPKGGDEINLLKKGHNYGWPIITYGKEYSGGIIGKTKQKGLEQPVHYFTPSIAPSGLAIYSGQAFPNWQGSFFSGSLVLTHINRVVINGKHKMLKEERFLTSWHQRIRHVKEGPDGFIYFSTDSGKLMRLVPM